MVRHPVRSDYSYIGVIAASLLVIAAVALTYGVGQSSSTTSESKIASPPNSVSTSTTLSSTLSISAISTVSTSVTFISPPPPVGTAGATSSTFTTPLYTLTFQQIACGGDIGTPWAVALTTNQTTQTIMNPTNASTAVIYGTGGELGPPTNESAIITFSVMPGTYTYTLLPSEDFSVEPNVNVAITVAGSTVVTLGVLCHP
jgi:hypothetical protein